MPGRVKWREKDRPGARPERGAEIGRDAWAAFWMGAVVAFWVPAAVLGDWIGVMGARRLSFKLDVVVLPVMRVVPLQ